MEEARREGEGSRKPSAEERGTRLLLHRGNRRETETCQRGTDWSLAMFLKTAPAVPMEKHGHFCALRVPIPPCFFRFLSVVLIKKS